jgi:hypothetical protein
MDLKYLKEINDSLTEEIFNSSLCVWATLIIKPKEVASDSVYSDNNFAIQENKNQVSLKPDYPIDLQKEYRIRVFPTETQGLVSSRGNQYEYKPVGIAEKWDRWISCKFSDVKVRTKNTLFDFTKVVQMFGNSFIIKGIVEENFGAKKIIHVFLGKDNVSV